MNFGSLIRQANKNKVVSANTKVKCFSTAVSPAVKPVRSHGPSPNVQAFLANQEREKRKKDLEFKKKKEQLLSLRAQSTKNNKKAKIMASRTKDNDFSRIRLTEDEMEAKGKREAELCRKMLTDKVERMKARIQLEEDDAQLPHKRKRKRKSEVSGCNDDDGGLEPEETKSRRGEYVTVDRFRSETPPIKKKKVPSQSSQPVSFQDLMKVAAQKQMDPEPEKSSSEEEEEEVEKHRRPMTKKDLERYREQEMRRKGFSVNNLTPVKKGKVSNSRSLPNSNRKENYSINNGTGNSRMNGNSKMDSPLAQNSRLYPQQNRIPDERRVPKLSQGQQMNPKGTRLENHRTLSANDVGRNNSSQLRNENQRTSNSSISNVSINRRKSLPTKINPVVDADISFKRPAVPSRQSQAPSRPTFEKSAASSQGRSIQDSRNRLPSPAQKEKYSRYDESPERSIKQERSVLPSRPKSYPDSRSNESFSNTFNQRSRTNPDGYRNQEQLPRQRNSAEYSGRMDRGLERKNREPSFVNQKANRSDPADKERFSVNQKPRPFSDGVKMSHKLPSQQRDLQRLPSSKPVLKDKNRIPSQSAKPSISKPQMQLKVPPQHVPSMRNVSAPERERLKQSLPKRPPHSSDSALERGQIRPIGVREVHIDRPKPKLPPIGHIRHKILGPRNPYGQLPSKASRNNYESEEEDDEEMNDFIDDGNNNECNEDYSKYIREIFGYDPRRYAFGDEYEDEAMESSFAEQMKEEARSARIGLLEDLEDIRKEEEERKALMMKKKKIKD